MEAKGDKGQVSLTSLTTNEASLSIIPISNPSSVEIFNLVLIANNLTTSGL